MAHAAIYSVDNRILAEAGQRPKNGLLGEAEGLYQTKITFQDVTAGHLRISLDMQEFQQPMTISLQSMGILSAILLALSLALSLRLGRHISTPLMQLRVWLRDIDEHTPATQRQDEIGDLARQLHANFAPEKVEPEPLPEVDYDDSDYDEAEEAEPVFEVRNLRDPSFDETAPAQTGEVVRNLRLRLAEPLHQLSDRQLALVAQELEDPHACQVAQAAEILRDEIAANGRLGETERSFKDRHGLASHISSDTDIRRY